ncbi:MAG: SAM-dependent chlorinase/fluorinase [Firmicutes bacterium]|nr:SAM-dependent chlorinase/fluorinase [Bacillota bacterium]
MGYILLQTDFGGTSAVMSGMCKLVSRDLHVYDLTHFVPKFNVKKAGENIAEVMPYWPAGTVFVSVCDPGVGTPRRACVAKTSNGCYVVTPDNGTLSPIMDRFGIDEVREIDQTINRYHGNEWSDKSDIFHGRDIFAYCGARLSAGVISFEQVGPAYPIGEIVTL